MTRAVTVFAKCLLSLLWEIELVHAIRIANFLAIVVTIMRIFVQMELFRHSSTTMVKSNVNRKARKEVFKLLKTLNHVVVVLDMFSYLHTGASGWNHNSNLKFNI